MTNVVSDKRHKWHCHLWCLSPFSNYYVCCLWCLSHYRVCLLWRLSPYRVCRIWVLSHYGVWHWEGLLKYLLYTVQYSKWHWNWFHFIDATHSLFTFLLKIANFKEQTWAFCSLKKSDVSYLLVMFLTVFPFLYPRANRFRRSLLFFKEQL